MTDAEPTFVVRNRPTQKRAQETFDRILLTTAELLEEVGFDKLNTNLICERASLTPPALYRYFPNKYSILEELGERLMKAQNDVSLKWMAKYENTDVGVEHLVENLREQLHVTRQFKGARSILVSLRSVPVLSEVRKRSHDRMNSLFTKWTLRRQPGLDERTVARRARISNEAGYAILEMLTDDDGNDVDATLEDIATMLVALS